MFDGNAVESNRGWDSKGTAYSRGTLRIAHLMSPRGRAPGAPLCARCKKSSFTGSFFSFSYRGNQKNGIRRRPRRRWQPGAWSPLASTPSSSATPPGPRRRCRPRARDGKSSDGQGRPFSRSDQDLRARSCCTASRGAGWFSAHDAGHTASPRRAIAVSGVLVDTSVWIDHFRSRNDALVALLHGDQVLTHPMVIGEIACATPPAPRSQTLADLRLLPMTQQAGIEEAMAFVERESLYGKGCGLVDMVLLSSTLISPGATLWTIDRHLAELAMQFGVAHSVSAH